MTPEEFSKISGMIFPNWPKGATPLERIQELEKREVQGTHLIVDIRNISKPERYRYDNCWAAIPPDVEEQLRNATFPLTPEEVNAIEDRVNDYHDVQEPNAILIQPEFAERGRCWLFEPALDHVQTGLIYFHNEK